MNGVALTFEEGMVIAGGVLIAGGGEKDLHELAYCADWGILRQHEPN